MKNKLNIIIIGIIVLVLTTGGLFYSKSSKDKKVMANNMTYVNSLKEVINEIDTEKSKVSIVTNKYSEIWQFVINGGMYFDSNGKQTSDFNVALKNSRATFEKEGTLQKLKDNKTNIEDKLKRLNNPSDKNKELYNLVVDIYSNYLEYEEFAELPSGSLQSFNQKTSELNSKITKGINEFNIKVK